MLNLNLNLSPRLLIWCRMEAQQNGLTLEQWIVKTLLLKACNKASQGCSPAANAAREEAWAMCKK